MRSTITDRFYRVFTYQTVDRVPDVEFGYWPQTIRRWLREGLPLELTPKETEEMFLRKLDDFFGFERGEGHGLPMRVGMNPPFQEEILERCGESVIMRDADGVIAERYLHDAERSSIPRFIEFPVKKPQDWVAMKERYRLDDPTRRVTDEEIAEARQAQAEGKAIFCGGVAFYGQLRNWMGTERLSYAFYDYPEMVHDMVEHWAELYACQIESLPPDILIDVGSWWEDMAGKSGPLVSPAVFREFLQPGYHRVMELMKERGCDLGIVDCDGNPYRIVKNWIEEGVNIMFPLEVRAGVEPYAWRKEFGRELRLKGGIDKAALVEGGRAIDRELERLTPLLEAGGFIPHLDHLVPPDIPYAHYCEYLEKKRAWIGRGAGNSVNH